MCGQALPPLLVTRSAVPALVIVEQLDPQCALSNQSFSPEPPHWTHMQRRYRAIAVPAERHRPGPAAKVGEVEPDQVRVGWVVRMQAERR